MSGRKLFWTLLRTPLFPLRAFSGLFEGEFYLYLYLHAPLFDPLKPISCFMYRQNVHILRSNSHSTFVCFVRISEQREITFVYDINSLIFIHETECVYCEVWTEYLNIIQFSFHLLSVNHHHNHKWRLAVNLSGETVGDFFSKYVPLP